MGAASRYGLALALLAIGLLPQMLFAQAASHDAMRFSAYTAEQAKRGKATYQSKCGMCHGPALEGQGPNSPLSGTVFMSKWDGLTVADLFMKTIVMMPANDPGTLPPKETADVIAYILSVNKFPAGHAELPSDPQSLEKIPILKP
jgi:mono/diheme cytochrome c family protein